MVDVSHGVDYRAKANTVLTCTFTVRTVCMERRPQQGIVLTCNSTYAKYNIDMYVVLCKGLSWLLVQLLPRNSAWVAT